MLKILLAIIALIVLFISYYALSRQSSSTETPNVSFPTTNNLQKTENTPKLTPAESTKSIDSSENNHNSTPTHKAATQSVKVTQTKKTSQPTTFSTDMPINRDEKDFEASVVTPDIHIDEDEKNLQDQAAEDAKRFQENLSQEERDILMNDREASPSQDEE